MCVGPVCDFRALICLEDLESRLNPVIKKNSKKAVHRIRERIPNFVLTNFHENETRKMF